MRLARLHRRFYFGNPSDIPLAGDFNDDGCDTLSVDRPSEAASQRCRRGRALLNRCVSRIPTVTSVMPMSSGAVSYTHLRAHET